MRSAASSGRASLARATHSADSLTAASSLLTRALSKLSCSSLLAQISLSAAMALATTCGRDHTLARIRGRAGRETARPERDAGVGSH